MIKKLLELPELLLITQIEFLLKVKLSFIEFSEWITQTHAQLSVIVGAIFLTYTTFIVVGIVKYFKRKIRNKKAGIKDNGGAFYAAHH